MSTECSKLTIARHAREGDIHVDHELFSAALVDNLQRISSSMITYSCVAGALTIDGCKVILR